VHEVGEGDGPGVQQQISTQISGRLRRQLSGEAKDRASRRYSANADAYDLYLTARYYSQKSTLADYQKGIEFSRRAIEKDPAFAPAYAAMASVYGAMTWEGLLSPKDGNEQMDAAVTKALKLDDSLADAHFALAHCDGEETGTSRPPKQRSAAPPRSIPRRTCTAGTTRIFSDRRAGGTTPSTR
jgi:hypothetical protein